MYELIPVLRSLANVEDVREIIKKTAFKDKFNIEKARSLADREIMEKERIR